jgi:hypothetical protein
LESAVEQLDLDKKIRVLDQSPLVESVAITEAGPDDSKPQYLNGVLKIATKHSPRGLLKKIELIEKLPPTEQREVRAYLEAKEKAVPSDGIRRMDFAQGLAIGQGIFKRHPELFRKLAQ